MRRPVSLAGLSRFAIAAGDPYLAIPLYPWVEGAALAGLEAIILAKPRNRLIFATMPFAPPRLLARLAEEPNLQIARRLAANPATPGETLRRVADRWPGDVRLTAAPAPRGPQHPRRFATPAVGDDSALGAGRALARRPDLPADIAARLARDPDSWTRRWLARNPATPVDLLHALAADPDLQVRRAVGRNPACPHALLPVLARDPAAWVRAAIAFRNDLSVELIQVLAADIDPDVLSGLGRNQASPSELLLRLAASGDPDIRRSVILNRAATSPVLETLLEDPYPYNRALLAVHPGLCDDAAWTLTRDPEPEIRYRAMARAVKAVSGGPLGCGADFRGQNDIMAGRSSR